MKGTSMLLDLGLSRAHARKISGPSSPYLDGVLNSTVFDLDATQSDSYEGTGFLWSNLVARCADGANPDAYDMQCGNGVHSSTFPSFIGTAGTQSAYWLMDGGDYFQLETGTNTDFCNGLHKTSGGPDWWAAITFRSAADDGTTTGLISTEATTTQTGIRITHQASEVIALIQRGDTATTSAIGSTVLSGSNNHIVIVTRDHGLGKTSIFVDGTTPQILDHSFNTSTSAPSGILSIGVLATNPTGGYLDNGTRIYSVAMGNTTIGPTEAQKIITHLNARHGRTYA